MLMEAVQVLHRCEKRTKKTIPKEDLTHAGLAKWLKPEDFEVLQVKNLIPYQQFQILPLMGTFMDQMAIHLLRDVTNYSSENYVDS